MRGNIKKKLVLYNLCREHASIFLFLPQARASEGCSFLNDCRDKWEDKEGPLKQHMAWHLGLFSLERGQETRARRVFDTLLSPPRVSKPYATEFHNNRPLPESGLGKADTRVYIRIYVPSTCRTSGCSL